MKRYLLLLDKDALVSTRVEISEDEVNRLNELCVLKYMDKDYLYTDGGIDDEGDEWIEFIESPTVTLTDKLTFPDK